MDDRDVIRSFETVSNKKVVGVVALVAVAVAGVIAVVVSGFHGEDVPQGADAVTKPLVPAPSR